MNVYGGAVNQQFVKKNGVFADKFCPTKLYVGIFDAYHGIGVGGQRGVLQRNAESGKCFYQRIVQILYL